METTILAIIPAAGLGKRCNVSKRKTFFSLHGIPLLFHTLKRLHSEEAITEIIPVLRQQDIEKGFEIAKQHKLYKIKRIAPGGPERQDSIYNAFKLLDKVGNTSLQEVLILIHDGVRPIIPEGLIENLLRAIKGFDGVAPGIISKDTLKEVSEDGIVISTVKREKIRSIQTPQVFPFNVIKKAYETAFKEGFYATDDASLVERIGGRVKIITGSPLNIKVTTSEDLEMVEYILTKRNVLK